MTTSEAILSQAGVFPVRLQAVSDTSGPAGVHQITAAADLATIRKGVFPSREAIQAHPWPYPDSSDDSEPLPPFPIDALPGDIGRYVAALAEYQQIAVDIPALVVLGALAVIAGGYATVSGHWTEKTLNLYLAALADSGEGKSPVVAAISAPVLAMEKQLRDDYDIEYGDMREQYEIAVKRRDRLISKIADADGSKVAELKAELDAVKADIEDNTPPPRPQLLAGDVTPESLGKLMKATCGHIGMLTDEGSFLGTLAGRYTKGGVANIDLILTGFDANQPYRVERIGRDSFEIERPSLSMTLCVQPVIAAEAVASAALVDRGLMNRFLFCRPESKAGHRDKRPARVPDHLHAAWARCVKTVFDTVLPEGTAYDRETKGPKPPLNLQIGETAEDVHYEWRVTLERRVDPDEGDLIGIKGWAKKLEGAAYRIAALLHLAAGEDIRKPVSEHTMRCAIRISEWSIPHAMDVLGQATNEADQSNAEAEKACAAVLGWIRRKGVNELTIRDVYTAIKRQTWVKKHGADGVRLALCELARRGYLTSTARTSEDGKQLPDGLFVVHPGVHGRGR